MSFSFLIAVLASALRIPRGLPSHQNFSPEGAHVAVLPANQVGWRTLREVLSGEKVVANKGEDIIETGQNVQKRPIKKLELKNIIQLINTIPEQLYMV
jgi:hypothetical protein